MQHPKTTVRRRDLMQRDIPRVLDLEVEPGEVRLDLLAAERAALRAGKLALPSTHLFLCSLGEARIRDG